ELYVTTLGDEVSPHIRYRTGDLYRYFDEPCECGADGPVVRAEGRAANALLSAERVLLTPRELDAIVGPAGFIELYSMEQVAAESFACSYAPNDKRDNQRERELEQRLQTALGAENRLRVECVRYIPAERGGKFLACKSPLAAKKARLPS